MGRRSTTNRLTAALKLYFPQVLDWFQDKDTQIFCDFLERWPDLTAAQRAGTCQPHSDSR